MIFLVFFLYGFLQLIIFLSFLISFDDSLSLFSIFHFFKERKKELFDGSIDCDWFLIDYLIKSNLTKASFLWLMGLSICFPLMLLQLNQMASKPCPNTSFLLKHPLLLYKGVRFIVCGHKEVERWWKLFVKRFMGRQHKWRGGIL